jgi:hypothetical protein
MKPNVRRSLTRAAAVVLVAGLTIPALFARASMTAGFRSKATRPMRLALLPPHAEFIKAKVVMTDQMTAETRALEAEAARAIEDQVRALGYEVRVVNEAEIAKNAALRRLVVALNDRYGEEWGRMMNYPRGVKQKRYTLGAEVVKLCAFLKVDGLIVSRQVAFANTKGKAFVSGMFNLGAPSQTSYLYLDAAVLNGRNGQVEGFFRGQEPSSLGQLTKKPAKVTAQACAKAFSRYPASTFAETVEDDGDTAAASAKDQGEVDDNAAIADFEALLGKGGGKPAKAAGSPKN